MMSEVTWEQRVSVQSEVEPFKRQCKKRNGTISIVYTKTLQFQTTFSFSI